MFEISEIEAKIECTAGTPRKDLLGTQIGVSVCGEELFPCDEKDKERRVMSDGEYKLLWSGRHNVQAYLFGFPEFQVKYEMVINWGSNKSGDDKFELRSFDKDMSKDGAISDKWEFDDGKGAHFVGTLMVGLKRTSGKTIGELMAEAKREVSSEQK